MAGEAIALLPGMFTVTVGAVEVTKQIDGAVIAFDTSTTTIKTLVEESDIATGEKATLTLSGYQDWPDPAGICNLLWAQSLQLGEFIIESTDQTGAVVTCTGTLQLRRPSFGPTADDAAKFSIDLPLKGIPDITVVPPAGNGATVEAEKVPAE
jgi:hypothetical protein